jgi:hypothetical protein
MSSPYSAILLLGLLAACGVGADVLRLDEVPRPQTLPDSVKLLAKEPTEPYAVIALISVTSADRGVDALRKRLLEEAARLGGHAVLFDSESLARGEEHRLSAKVIVFDRAHKPEPQSDRETELTGALGASAGPMPGGVVPQ